MSNKGTDEYYMKIALKEASKGRGWTNPNPMVGAVIVKNDKIIAKGYHKAYKSEHAEVNAINNSKEDLEGSTMYVTLEPCSHYGNTPPCVDKIIESKINKVVIASKDPNLKVNGNGIKKLRENNIEVVTGVLDEENKKLNEVFMKYIKSREPFVVMKSAMSLDGKIATAIGESKWISSEESRNKVHKLRGQVSGILVGVNTIIEDDPKLTCRLENKKSPIRIVVDSGLRIPIESTVVKESNIVKTIVVTVKEYNEEKSKKTKQLESHGVKVLKVSSKDKRVNLKEMLQEIGRLNIDSILLEGGSELNFSMLEENLIDKIQVYIAPKIIGGKLAKPFVGGQGFEALKDCIDIEKMTVEKIGKDLLIEGYIKKEQ